MPSRAREVDPSRAREVLHRLQVTAGPFLGAMALHSGGIIADHGWFRLYGGGSPGMPDLAEANGLAAPSETTEPPGLLYVGDDAVGGRFAIDGGALGIAPGEVCYLGPDTLAGEVLVAAMGTSSRRRSTGRWALHSAPCAGRDGSVRPLH